MHTMGTFLINYPPSKLLDILVKTLAIIGLLVATGFLDITANVEVHVLKPVWLINLDRFREHCAQMVTADYNLHYKELLKDLDSNGNCSWLYIDMPVTTPDSSERKRRAVIYDGRVRTISPFGAGPQDYKWQLGHLDEDTAYLNKRIISELVTEEDRRIAASTVILWDRLKKDHVDFCEINNDSLKALVNKYPTAASIYFPLVNAGAVYNIISIENNSSSKTENVILKVLVGIAPVPAFSVQKIVGWTATFEGGTAVKDSGEYVEFSLPFMRGKNSIQLVVRTYGYRLEREDVAVEYSKTRSIDKGKVLWYLILAGVLSLILYVYEGVVVSASTSKKSLNSPNTTGTSAPEQ